MNSQLKDTEKNWWGQELEDGKKGNLWQTQGLGSGKVSRGRRKLRRTEILSLICSLSKHSSGYTGPGTMLDTRNQDDGE